MEKTVDMQGPSLETNDESPIYSLATTEKKEDVQTDPYVVDFGLSPDRGNPQDWSARYKWTMTLVLATVTLLVNWTTLMCAPAAPQILAELGGGTASGLDSTLLVTLFDLGQVLSPLLFAPTSEVWGRRPVYNITNLLYVVWCVAGGFSQSVSAVLAFRFLIGTAVASGSLNSAIVGDLFAVEKRGRAMAVLSLPPLLGPSLGPVIGSYLAAYHGWRWTFWLPAIICASVGGVFFLLYRETYKVTILRGLAANKRRETGNAAWRSRYDENDDRRAVTVRRVGQAVVRPLKLLFVSPVLLVMGLYTAVVYSYVYIIINQLTGVFQSRYGFSDSAVGLSFLGVGLGMAAGVLFCWFTLDRWVQLRHAQGDAQPEARLPPMILGGLILPAGLFGYGWTVENSERVHWIVPVLFTAVVGFGLTTTRVPALSYIVDAFGIHAASAVSAITLLSYVIGAFLPLAGPALYDRLGLGWGNSVLGFIALAFLPVPLLLMRFGGRLRERSSFRAKF